MLHISVTSAFLRVQQLLEFLLKADHAVVDFLVCDVRRVALAIADWGNTWSPFQGSGLWGFR
jgi:hypothetical protein